MTESWPSALRIAVLLPLLTGLAEVCAGQAEHPPEPAKASLLVEHKAVAPGSATPIGIRFQLENGWHIYWQNPGDAGDPPRVNWRVPDGFGVGALRWPAPKRLQSVAGTDYGYEGDVILLSSLQVPASAKPGESVELAGDLRWVACHDVCVPQKAEVKTSLQIAKADAVDEGAKALLASAGERLPKALPKTMQATVRDTGDAFVVQFRGKRGITAAEFFPAQEDQIDNAAPQALTVKAGGTDLKLKKSERLQGMPERLKGVLVVGGEAYEVDAPVLKTASVTQRRR